MRRDPPRIRSPRTTAIPFLRCLTRIADLSRFLAAGKGERSALSPSHGGAGQDATRGHGLHRRGAGCGDVLVGPERGLVEGGRENVEVLAEVSNLCQQTMISAECVQGMRRGPEQIRRVGD